MDYEIIDVSGDVGIRAKGKDYAEALMNAGIGLYSLVTDIEKLGDEKTIDIDIKSDSPERLLVNYLNELIFHFDTYGFIGKRIEVKDHSAEKIRAIVYGEYFDSSLHESRLLLKAATYHKIKIEQGSEGWLIEVIFDI
jgi:SHS2 domain-containing protein